MRIVAIVTAAGSAVRFGGRKLLTAIDGRPLLDHTIRALLDGGVGEVVVVLAPGARAELEAGVDAMRDPRVRAVENPDPSRGMFTSIQAGAAETDGDAILVLPGDMPFVSAATVRAVVDAYTSKPAIVSPRFQGKRGHPVALPGWLRTEIGAAPLGTTLHDILKKHAELYVDLDLEDRGVVRDVDTLEDLRDRLRG